MSTYKALSAAKHRFANPVALIRDLEAMEERDACLMPLRRQPDPGLTRRP
jgi:hypothetical protein